MKRALAALITTALLAACSPMPEARSSVVDSVVPREVALARFRQGLVPVESLAGGAPSLDSLVRLFIGALERSDTAALHPLVMTRAEFAYIYYPTNPQSLPPYDLNPDLLWFLIEGRSRQGAAAIMEERAGHPLGYIDVSCDRVPSIEGENRVWGPCLVRRVQEPGDTVAERLFGPVIERHGRFKFVSLANKL